MKGVLGCLQSEYLNLSDLWPHLTKGSNCGVPPSGARECLLHLLEMTPNLFLVLSTTPDLRHLSRLHQFLDLIGHPDVEPLSQLLPLEPMSLRYLYDHAAWPANPSGKSHRRRGSNGKRNLREGPGGGEA